MNVECNVTMSGILEMCMLIAFGCAWPASIVKSWRSRTTVGKSPAFLAILLVGYVCGIVSKIAGHEVNYIVIFYAIDFLMVGTDFLIYFRNRRLDQRRAEEAAKMAEEAENRL